MARPLRIEFPGAVYHVTSRGNERGDIFLSDRDRVLFLKVLEETVGKFGWICHAYCLMTNHYHLMIEMPNGNLSIGMRQLNGVYTQSFNRRRNRVGHVFQGRYKAVLVQKDNHLLELCRYIVLNPVRAGLVDKPDKYEWSSYQAAMGLAPAPRYLFIDWVLSQFGDVRQEARLAYERFVWEGLDIASEPDQRTRSVIGDKDFIESLTPFLTCKTDLLEIPKAQRYIHRPSLDRLFTGPVVEVRGARNLAIIQAHREYGYTQQEIARHIGLHYSWVSRIIAKEGRERKK